MHGIGGNNFWCPRCGTVKNSYSSEYESPSLVGRITEFAGKLTDEHEDLIIEFERLGVRECITIIR